VRRARPSHAWLASFFRRQDAIGKPPIGAGGAATLGHIRPVNRDGGAPRARDIDSKDARNAGLRLHPPLAITDTRIVDYRVEAPELVDLVGNGCCSGDGGEVPGNNSAGAGCRRERVATLPSLAAGRTLNPTRRLASAGDEAR
jgi:hypothetical protein